MSDSNAGAEGAGETRVSMNWPNDLKAAVRDRVGSRGLTTFVLAAVREKLGASSTEQATEDLKPLVERLFRVVASLGSHEAAREVLEDPSLPSWLGREELTKITAQAEAAEQPSRRDPKPIAAATPTVKVGTPAPLAPLPEQPATPAPVPEIVEPEVRESVASDAPMPPDEASEWKPLSYNTSSERLEELRSKMLEMGMVPASELAPPAPKPNPEPNPESEPEAAPEPEPAVEVVTSVPRQAISIEDLDEFDAGF